MHSAWLDTANIDHPTCVSTRFYPGEPLNEHHRTAGNLAVALHSVPGSKTVSAAYRFPSANSLAILVATTDRPARHPIPMPASEDEIPDHIRHRPPVPLQTPRPLVLCVPQLRSGVNLSRLVRLAGCCGITRMIASGNVKIDPTIARDATSVVRIDRHRSLQPQLLQLRRDGFQLVGLEQSSHSQNLHEFRFPHRVALCLGHERDGMDPETMRIMDALIEIPVYGVPYSYNVVTAATMALYEYCRQFPAG